MFRSHDHPQGAYKFLAKVIILKHSVNYFVMLIWCCGSMSGDVCESYGVQNEAGYGCASYVVQREEKYMLPEDDRVVETCRNVFNF